MALIIMGSSGGRCDRSGSALPVMTMHAAGGARGASRVSAAINMTAQKRGTIPADGIRNTTLKLDTLGEDSPY